MNSALSIPGQPSPAYRWLIIILSLATYTISMVIRYAWPPLAPVVLPVLEAPVSEAGAYMSAFYLGYVLTQIPAGVLADRFGVRGLLALSLLVQAGAAYAFGNIESFQSGLPLRVLSGLSGGLVYASCFRAVVNWFPARERGLAFGLLLVGPSLGLTLANALAPGLEPLWGWRGVFQSMGWLALGCALLVLAFMRESPTAASGSPLAAPQPGAFLSGLKFVLGDRNLRLLCLAGFCYIWAFVGFVTWGNIYLKDILQLSLSQAGSIMSGMAVLSLVLAPPAGFLARDSRRSRQLLIISSLLLVAGVLFFGQTASVPLLWALTLTVGLACGFMNPIISLVVSYYAPKKWAGAAGGFTACIWQSAGVLSPLFCGWTVGQGAPSAWSGSSWPPARPSA